MDEVVWFIDVYYEYFEMVIVVGYVIVVLGWYFVSYGVVGNGWVFCEMKKDVYCVEDFEYGWLFVMMFGEVFGDWFKECYFKVKVFFFGGKDCLMIFCGGYCLDGFYWYD